MERKKYVILIVGKTNGKENNKEFIEGLNACLPFTSKKIPVEGSIIIQTETLEGAKSIMAGIKTDILMVSKKMFVLGGEVGRIGIANPGVKIYTFDNGRVSRIAGFTGSKG